jgi:hypothetical protein
VLALVPPTEDIVRLDCVWRLEAGRPRAWFTHLCVICWQPDGRHWTVPHVHMPRTEQGRIRRWFSEEEAEVWLRRRLLEMERE